MTELESEILFLRQAITARRIAATLPERPMLRQAYKACELPPPEGNGHRASLREIGIASCPLAPDSRTTTRGRVSKEGQVTQLIARNELEIAKLKAELGIS